MKSVMSKIKVLPDDIANRIAAGEVVERPASVVKELMENSLDAGAAKIAIDVEEGGRKLIRVTDNGEGMVPEDALSCFGRHKILSQREGAFPRGTQITVE